MPLNKSLSRAAYFLGILLVAIPIIDLVLNIWPLRISDARWRFGAVGTLSGVLVVPLLGLLIILAFAVWQDHRRVQRITGAICIAFAVLLAILDVLFILDFFQTRTMVVPRAQHAVTMAASVAFIKNLLTIGVLILMGRGGFAGPKPIARRKGVVVKPVTDTILTRPASAGAVE
jgi:chromate transport protein ChrA